jgi:hypothetical protein
LRREQVGLLTGPQGQRDAIFEKAAVFEIAVPQLAGEHRIGSGLMKPAS